MRRRRPRSTLFPYTTLFRSGAGSKVKIINQLLAGVHIAAAAEAMALGLREGVDAAALYEVITLSAGNSWMVENRIAHRSEEHTSELQSTSNLVCRPLLVSDN